MCPGFIMSTFSKFYVSLQILKLGLFGKSFLPYMYTCLFMLGYMCTRYRSLSFIPRGFSPTMPLLQTRGQVNKTQKRGKMYQIKALLIGIKFHSLGLFNILWFLTINKPWVASKKFQQGGLNQEILCISCYQCTRSSKNIVF